MRQIRITDYERLCVERAVSEYIEKHQRTTRHAISRTMGPNGYGRMSDAEDLLNAIGHIYKKAAWRTKMAWYAQLENKEQF